MANDGEVYALKKQIAKQSDCILELGKELGEVSAQALKAIWPSELPARE